MQTPFFYRSVENLLFVEDLSTNVFHKRTIEHHLSTEGLLKEERYVEVEDFLLVEIPVEGPEVFLNRRPL